MSVEGIEVDVFYGQEAQFLAVELAASLEFPYVNPVRSPIG